MAEIDTLPVIKKSNPFDRNSPDFYEDRLVADPAVEDHIGYARGTILVKRCRGDWPIPSVKVGRSRRTRVGDVLDHFKPVVNSAA